MKETITTTMAIHIAHDNREWTKPAPGDHVGACVTSPVTRSGVGTCTHIVPIEVRVLPTASNTALASISRPVTAAAAAAAPAPSPTWQNTSTIAH